MTTFIVGETGLGKTRLAGRWPVPLWLNGEPDGPTTALPGSKKPQTIDIMMDANAIRKLNAHLKAISKETPDENGMIHYNGFEFGSVVLDTFDAFQDIAKMIILGSRETMRQDDWGKLETKMRKTLIYIAAIKVPTVIVSHVKRYERGDNRFGRIWWSAQGSITVRMDRLASEILHVTLGKNNERYVATRPIVLDGYKLIAKDRHDRLRALANEHGLINIHSEDGYPSTAIPDAILGLDRSE